MGRERGQKRGNRAGTEDDWPVLERYDGLAQGDLVVARANDVEIPGGARGVVLRRVEETGNWLVRFDLDDGERLVALCPWQLRPEAATNASRRRRRIGEGEQAGRMAEHRLRERAIGGDRGHHGQRRRETGESGARRCGRCGEELSPPEFHLRRQESGNVGYQAYCRECDTVWRRERRAARRDPA